MAEDGSFDPNETQEAKPVAKYNTGEWEDAIALAVAREYLGNEPEHRVKPKDAEGLKEEFYNRVEISGYSDEDISYVFAGLWEGGSLDDDEEGMVVLQVPGDGDGYVEIEATVDDVAELVKDLASKKDISDDELLDMVDYLRKTGADVYNASEIDGDENRRNIVDGIVDRNVDYLVNLEKKLASGSDSSQ